MKGGIYPVSELTDCTHEGAETTYEDKVKRGGVYGKLCLRCGTFTPKPDWKKLGFVEWVLTKLFPYTDIKRDGTNEIYLRRFFIYPRDKDFGKNVGKGRIYLHKFYKGDEDPHMHSHPWPFTSLILTGGYWEETHWDPKDAESGRIPAGARPYTSYYGADEDESDQVEAEERIRIFYPRWSILKRPATWVHRVILKDKNPVWTLVRTGVKERSWGFWVRGKMCPWREYDNGECLVEPITPKD